MKVSTSSVFLRALEVLSGLRFGRRRRPGSCWAASRLRRGWSGRCTSHIPPRSRGGFCSRRTTSCSGRCTPGCSSSSCCSCSSSPCGTTSRSSSPPTARSDSIRYPSTGASSSNATTSVRRPPACREPCSRRRTIRRWWLRPARAGDEGAVRELLAGGADVDAPAVDGATALHWAVHRDAADLVHLLIEAGADVAVLNRYGVQPIALEL